MARSDEIIVVGHRNPDNDAICAAVGYAYLKNVTDSSGKFVAYRQGPLPDETRWVLDRFEVAPPRYIPHVHSRVADAMTRDVISISHDNIMLEAGRMMRAHNIRAIVVTDDDGRYMGLVTERKLAEMYIDEVDIVDTAESVSKLGNIAKACNGRIVLGDPGMEMRGHLRVAASEPATFHEIVKPGDTVVMGDRVRSQRMAVEAGVACLILAVGAQPDEGIVEMARRNGTAILCVEQDTYTATRLATLAQTVEHFLETDACTFEPDAILSEAIPEFLRSHQREAVVLDEAGRCIGIISRTDVAVFPRRKVILVDHNEQAQSVPGILEADIVGIVDHHRVGDLQTSAPISFVSLPWGSTATIVAEEFRRMGVEVPPEIAGVLLSAVMTDTVLLKSPTTTQVDRDVAERLGAILGIDPLEFGVELFLQKGDDSSLDVATLVGSDAKEFEIADQKVFVGQHETADIDAVMERKDEIAAYLEELRANRGYATALFMLTDIINAGSQFFVAGDARIVERAFERRFGADPVWMEGILSRKKQVIAALVRQAI